MGLITSQEKIEFLQSYVDGIQRSIDILEQDIIDDPSYNIEGKPTRQNILQDLISQKASLLNEIEGLK